jgi:hypothetical protein
MKLMDKLLIRDRLPDWLIRIGIRRLLRQRLDEEKAPNAEAQRARLLSLVEELKASPIAIETAAANEQHYEVPTRFYQLCLGARLKYSSGYWDDGLGGLDEAEERMLRLTCERAELADGQAILELGRDLDLDGGAVSASKDHGGVQFGDAERPYRRGIGAARLDELAGHHLRYESLRHGTGIRSRDFSRDV